MSDKTLEFRVELCDVEKQDVSKPGSVLNYVALYDSGSQAVTLYAEPSGVSSLAKKGLLHAELRVGSGKMYLDSDGKLVLEGSLLKGDVLPHRIAGILAVVAQGKLRALGVDTSESRIVIDENNLHPFWHSPNYIGFLRDETVQNLYSDEETSLVVYDPKLFDQKSLEKIGTTQQHFSKALALAGIPQEEAGEVLYLMTVRHDDAKLRPGDLVRFKDVGFRTVDDISALLKVEEAMAGRSDAWNITAEAEILDRARRTKLPEDVSSAEFVQTMQDTRRYALHLLTSRFSGELDLESLSDDYLTDINARLKGPESLPEKIIMLVDIADSCEISNFEAAIDLFNNAHKNSGYDSDDELDEDDDSDSDEFEDADDGADLRQSLD